MPRLSAVGIPALQGGEDVKVPKLNHYGLAVPGAASPAKSFEESGLCTPGNSYYLVCGKAHLIHGYLIEALPTEK